MIAVWQGLLPLAPMQVMDYIGPWDFILVPIFTILAILIARRIQFRRESDNPVYQYYTRGMMAKIFGGLALAIIYVFYYGGGDTLNYWEDAGTLRNLMFKDFFCYLDILFGDTSIMNFFCFDDETGSPASIFLRDSKSYAVTRFTSIPYALSIDSFFGCTILVAIFSYMGVWRLYIMFTNEYPTLRKEMAIAVLFIPSVLFWGSGILKDTYTFSAACWFAYSFYNVSLRRHKVLINLAMVVVNSIVLISVKPYIFLGLMPGCLVLLVFKRMQSIESNFIKILSFPMFFMIAAVIGGFVVSRSAESLGAYGSVDSLLDKAAATQQDLKREAYEGNSFDIGDFDASLTGIISKAPAAIFAGLFRPTLLDVRNVVMLISAIENTVIMLLFLYLLLRIGPFGFMKVTLNQPLVMFCFSFAIFFAFSVGLTTSNFGSLVRYKIPAMPFFVAGLYIVRYRWMLERGIIEEEIPEEEQVVTIST
ncbi:MAG: hypothetical protein ACI85F_001108 [Bacteroidia bacterium]|jgi:hypothetical protein